jgi:hypothetical protein
MTLYEGGNFKCSTIDGDFIHFLVLFVGARVILAILYLLAGKEKGLIDALTRGLLHDGLIFAVMMVIGALAKICCLAYGY